MNIDNFFGYSVRLNQLSEVDGGGWIASIPELRGCLADGQTPDEAYEELKTVLEFWLQVAKEEEKVVPQPMFYETIEYSGRIMLRMPKNLHRILAERAEHEGVSLNQYMVSLLSYNAGRLEQTATKSRQQVFNIWIQHLPKRQNDHNTEDIFNRLQQQTEFSMAMDWERVAKHEVSG